MTEPFGQYIQDLERNMSNKNIIRLKEERVNLLSLIKKYKNHKKQLVNLRKNSREKLTKFAGSELSYYRKAIRSYKEELTILNREISKVNLEFKKPETKITLAIGLLFLILVAFSYYFIQPSITGFTIADSNVTNISESIFTTQPIKEQENLTKTVIELNSKLEDMAGTIEKLNQSIESLKLTIAALANTNNTNNEFTIQPVNETIPIIENITEIIVDRVLEWNYSQLPKEKADKIKDKEVYFDGKDYEIINNSEFIELNKSFTIKAEVMIEENSSGVILSRYDYANVTNIELSVDITGSIKFNIFDVSFSDILETNKTYNDGKFHSITALINNNSAQIYVDGNLEAESNVSELKSLYSNVPFTIGANTGLVNLMGSSINNFNGRIKEVKIYY